MNITAKRLNIVLKFHISFIFQVTSVENVYRIVKWRSIVYPSFAIYIYIHMIYAMIKHDSRPFDINVFFSNSVPKHYDFITMYP